MLAVAVLSSVLLFPAYSHAAAPYMLANGDSINVGEKLENGPYRLILQNGGNLVLYWKSFALWSSGTPTANDTNSTPIVRLEVSSTGRVALVHADGGIAWHHGPHSGQPGLYLTWNGNVRLGTSSALTTWQSGTQEQTYSLVGPDSEQVNYCFEPGVPQDIRDGYPIAMSHAMAQTKYSWLQLPACETGVDIQVRYGGMTGSNAYAVTSCDYYRTVDGYPNQCDHGMTKYNPAKPHHAWPGGSTPSNYASVACHETGHLFGLPDNSGNFADNRFVLPAEQHCVKSGPDLVRYSERQVEHMDGLYP